MREIKFRAWFTNGKEVFAINPYFFEEQGLMEWQDVRDNSLYTFLQFTGLHDKNGKEIYEGDVVRIGSRPPVEVRWHKDSAGFLQVGMELMSNTEVIGNIYENPELLN